MKNRHLHLNVSVPVLAAIMLFSLFSCGGAPQNSGESGLPATSGTAAVSPAVTPPAPISAPTPSPSPSPSPSPPVSASEIPAEWADNGIFSDYYEKAYALLVKMTLEEKIGQMMLVRCPQAGAVDFITRFQPGGLVLFEADFTGKTMDGVISMTQSYQNAAKIPLIMSTDEEGGSVVRISRNRNLSDHTFQSPQKLYGSGGLEAVREDTLNKASLFKKLGLNLNLAPVADVCLSPGDYMYARSLGQPAAQTGDYIAAVITAMRELNLSAALKHFPGYGGNTDTHTGIAVDNRPYSAFFESDFLPFEKGIAAGAQSILVSHNIVSCMDANVPASLSPVVHNVLRNTLDFTGIIITDGLSMAAIRDYTGSADPAVQAVLAGNDMLLLDDFEGASAAVLAAVQNGELSDERIDHAVFRILAWKMSCGIIK